MTQGTVRCLQHKSEILENNPPGDKFIRDVFVYLPPDYEEDKFYPSVYVLTGFTGRGRMLLNDSAFTPNFAERMDKHPLRFHGYQSILPRPLFPGPGAVPITSGGRVVGGYSSNISSNKTGMKIMVDGKKLSRCDIVNAHAVQAPYIEQHADVP